MDSPNQQKDLVSRLIALMTKSPQTFIYRKRNGQMRRGHGTLEQDVIKPHLGLGNRKQPETATAYWDLDKNAWRSFRNLHLNSIFEYYPVFRYAYDGFGVVDKNGAILAPLVRTTTLANIGPGFMSKYIAESGYRKVISKVLEISKELRVKEGAKDSNVKPTMSVMTSTDIMKLIETIDR